MKRRKHRKVVDVKKFRRRFEVLRADMSSVRGRDANIVVKDCEQLVAEIREATGSSVSGKVTTLIREINEVRDEAKMEMQLEKGCAKWISRIGVLLVIIPMFVTCAETLSERMTRKEFVARPETAHLDGTVAVVTGGCSGIGHEVSNMLESSGALVFCGCREKEGRHFSNFDGDSRRVIPLDLASFDSVRNFASAVEAAFEEDAFDNMLIVHNAATYENACEVTEDGHEVAFQTHVLAPTLINRLLLPSTTLYEDTTDDDANDRNDRIVFVSCDAALAQEDWLPWPLQRRTAASVPSIIQVGGTDFDSKRCDPGLAYASSKLSALGLSNALSRRGSTTVIAVNPGPTDTRGSASPTAPTGRTSLRAQIFQYFPPVWIFRKVVGLVKGAAYRLTLRSPRVGASAVFHAATSASFRGVSDLLLSDQASPLVDCGTEIGICGAVKTMPSDAMDDEKAHRLWAFAIEATDSYV